MVEIYTDGAARGNPGPGGYGVVLLANGHRKELAKGFRLTTNNRMELMAVIAGLEALKKQDLKITIYSDSKYVVDAINKGWLFGWQKKNFAGKKNPDLWKEFLQLYPITKPTFVWIKGHNEHPQNERADKLAVAAALQPNLPADEGFETEEKTAGLF